MEHILSNITRDIISEYRTDVIREKREEISITIKQRFIARIIELKFPVETTDVLITNIDYPPEVTAMRKAIKNAELQDQENAALAIAAVASARRDAELALVQGKAELVKAKADAAVNRVLEESLTDEVLSVLQLETLLLYANGPNNSVYILPESMLNNGSTFPETIINRAAIMDLAHQLQDRK